jgi:hypothetical protein
MGPFLADRVPTRTAYWLFGVAIATSVVSLATLERASPPRQTHGMWKHHGCKSRATIESRPRLQIGPMAEAGTYRDIMRETVKTTLAKTNNWSLELVETPPAHGYFVDGTVDEFRVNRVGEASYVECELKLWVRSSGKVVSNLVSGGARVETSHGQRDIALSRQACVTTVAEELVEKLFSPVID